MSTEKWIENVFEVSEFVKLWWWQMLLIGCFPEHLCICASCSWPQSERVLVCRSLRDCAPRWDSARSFYEPCCDSGSLEADSQALIYTATEKCSVIGNQTCESRHGFRALSGRAAVYQARPFMPHPRGLGVNLMDLRRLIQENMKLAGNAFSIRSDLLFVSPARRTLSFVMENFEQPCKTRQSHLASTHVLNGHPRKSLMLGCIIRLLAIWDIIINNFHLQLQTYEKVWRVSLSIRTLQYIYEPWNLKFWRSVSLGIWTL